ncbi:NINE protein [Rathayibacter iranicus]|uniref:NINE protein n=2 Tax=Rathayibacter iranicus TaxID=59737 RepID=A0AAD2PTV2_9MICO|nr:NINE protein [Rathayibacter iranicus]AZZ54998.1 NINE protein [Rathayibacter iranicus]MWV32276.1 NINE protein [Rathayibacter iranicus NCPPB 2253 = VKM Ac-1602]PPI62382.1 TM2 domain-containing protein [Rathayibacter iranicus]
MSAPAPSAQSTVVVIAPKSLAVTLLLWFFLGGLGGHKWYLRQPVMACVYIVLTVIGTPLMALYGLGLVFLIPLWIMLIIDLFFMSARIRKLNTVSVPTIEATSSHLG